MEAIAPVPEIHWKKIRERTKEIRLERLKWEFVSWPTVKQERPLPLSPVRNNVSNTLQFTCQFASWPTVTQELTLPLSPIRNGLFNTLHLAFELVGSLFDPGSETSLFRGERKVTQILQVLNTYWNQLKDMLFFLYYPKCK